MVVRVQPGFVSSTTQGFSSVALHPCTNPLSLVCGYSRSANRMEFASFCLASSYAGVH